MSFLRKLFGIRESAGTPEPAAATAELDYKGFTLRAIPLKDQGQYLVAGTIEKSVDGVVKIHRFVRADRSPDRDEITEISLMKARLMVDQQGESLLS